MSTRTAIIAKLADTEAWLYQSGQLDWQDDFQLEQDSPHKDLYLWLAG